MAPILLSLCSMLGCQTNFEPIGRLSTEQDYSIQSYVEARFHQQAMRPANYVPDDASLLSEMQMDITALESQQLHNHLSSMLPKWVSVPALEKISTQVRKLDTNIGSFYTFHFVQKKYKTKKSWLPNLMGTGSDSVSFNRVFSVMLFAYKGRLVFVERPFSREVDAYVPPSGGLYIQDVVKIHGIEHPGVIVYKAMQENNYHYYFYSIVDGKISIHWSSYMNKGS